MASHDARYWIERLDLQPHPEGGYYRLTYTAATVVAREALPPGFNGARPVMTAIYFLLSNQAADRKRNGHFSAFHRLRADEMWHFYAGGPLMIHAIAPDGRLQEVRLGPDLEQGQAFQTIIPGGHWFASAPLLADTFTLVGCTVAPGFDFADFEIARRAELVQTYPQHRVLIEALTRE